jgi:S1-C subfamily serine protease
MFVSRRSNGWSRWAAAFVVGSALLLAACGAGHATTPTGGSTASTGLSASSAPQRPATALEQEFVAVVKETQPEVVQIQTDSGLGSGVIFDAQGHIVTNAHVTGSATRVLVTLADGRRLPARLVGAYAPDDLAVITIGAGRAVKPARFANSSKLAVGEIVLAEGNPLGLQSSVTEGIISALGRSVSEGQGVVLPDSIQTSAAINPGNSGGALIDLQGQVIGIPTLAAANPQLGSAASGIGFAIPSNTVTDIASQIVRYGRVVNSHRAAIGASLADSSARPGALVVALQEGGPAARAGLAVGDLIEKVDHRQVTDVSAFAGELARHEPGDKITVSILALDGASRTTTVTLGQLPGS